MDDNKVNSDQTTDNKVVNEVNQEVKNDGTSSEQNNVTTSNVISETVVEANAQETVQEKENVVDSGQLEEISVVADSDSFNNLKETDISPNSVFNKKEDNNNIGTGMKEGEEYDNKKKGFPVFAVIVVIITIVIAFNIETFSGFINNLLNGKNNNVEKDTNEQVEKDDNEKGISLNEIKDALEKSSNLNDFQQNYDVKIDIQAEGDILSITTTDYINKNNLKYLTVNYVLKDGVLTAICDFDNSEFGRQMSLYIIEEIAVLQGLERSEVKTFINDNM